jgi:hypothetical protein
VPQITIEEPIDVAVIDRGVDFQIVVTVGNCPVCFHTSRDRPCPHCQPAGVICLACRFRPLPPVLVAPPTWPAGVP